MPLSVTAFDATTIENAFDDNISEFSRMSPNVTLARQPYAGNAVLAGMRGIVFGDLEKSFGPAVGVVVDGVALVTNTGALIDNFDLESIEIPRGPQSTLFGRNTIAGVVNVRRSRPTGETDGRGHHIPGEDTTNVYTSFLWEPNENFDALLTLKYIDDDSTLSTPTNLTVPNLSAEQWGAITGGIFANIGTGVPPAAAVGGGIGATLVSGGNFCDIHGAVLAPLNGWVSEVACAKYGYELGEQNGYQYSISAQNFNNAIKQKGYMLEINYDLGDFRFTSVTGYKEEEELLDQDNLGTPIHIFHPWRPQEYDQFSTELRVVSDYGGKFDFVGGIYYVESSYFITASVYVFGNRSLPGASPSPDGDASGVLPPTAWSCGLDGATKEHADAVGRNWILTAPTTEAAAIRTAGLQCNSDGKENWTEFTPRISFDYAWSDNVMAYLSWSRGFRSGGFNGRATTPTSMGAHDPEIVDSYEIGLRSSLMNERPQFNATLFRSEYQDKRESEIYQFGTAAETVVNNAAEATIDGMEIEAQFLATERIQLRFALGMIDGVYEEFLAPDRIARQGISRAACPRLGPFRRLRVRIPA